MAKEFLQKLNIQDDEIQSKKRVVTEIIEHRQEIGVLKEQNRALREENAVLKAAQKMNDDQFAELMAQLRGLTENIANLSDDVKQIKGDVDKINKKIPASMTKTVQTQLKSHT